VTPDDYGWTGDRCQPDRMTTVIVGGSKFMVNKRARANWLTFLVRFDREVERIALDGWDGGYACRPVRGSTSPSFHSWGLAVDLNASRHPLGQAGTFTRAQVVAIRRLLAAFPELRWGGDYTKRKDEQHFEIIKAPAECAALAKKRAVAVTHPFPLPRGQWYGPESSNPANHSGLDVHDQDDIRLIRAKLKAGTSPRYDTALAGTVRAFQKAHGLTADGLVGKGTWDALKP
jgi:peptidoglycan hydrolase-like protein with peptidoglycan-binding domain